MSQPPPTVPPAPKRRRRWVIGLTLIVILASGLGWAVIARASTLRVYVVPSSSMAPTIEPGDRFCVDERPGMAPKRGELWIFAMPPSGLGVPGLAIKRVIGLPGETIRVEGGKVRINGKEIDEPYLSGPISYTLPTRVLGPEEFFLLGDNRNASNDSHIWGPVPAARLMGRVLYRVWPLRRAGGL
jgi:signal peptidase I